MRKQFLAMLKARTMEFVRDRQTFFWNLLFPIVIIVGFALVFQGNGEKLFKVGVIGASSTPPAFLDIAQIDFVHYKAEDEPLDRALNRLRQHQLDLVVDVENKKYWTNAESGKSLLLKRFFQSDTTSSAVSTGFVEDKVTGKAVRYVDWAVPGVIGMNMMFSCLFGIGFVIVRYRKNGVLKRLKATPVSAFNFVSAQGVSRFLIVLATCVVVYAGTTLFLNFTMNGSYLDLLVVASLGIVSLISLGLLFAARFKSEELSGGIMNLVTFPMIFLSGVFYSLEGAPDIVLWISQALPLTHFIDASRKIMLEGATLVQLAPDLLYLGGFTALMLALSSWLFKWE